MIPIKYNSNVVVVNTKSNFKSHLVKCQSIMDNINFNEVIIKGIGRATTRACNLALQLNKNNFDVFEIKPRTYTVEFTEEKRKRIIRGSDLDGFDPDVDTPKKVSIVAALEIVVRKSKIEIEKMKKLKKST